MTRFVAIIISLLFFVSCVSGRVLVDADHKDESKNAPSIRIPNVITSDGATKKVSMKLAFWTNEVFADIMDQIAIHAGDGKFRFVLRNVEPGVVMDSRKDRSTGPSIETGTRVTTRDVDARLDLSRQVPG